MQGKSRAVFFCFFLLASPLFAQYPLIRLTRTSADPLYGQHQQDIESWYAGNPPPLTLFRYIPKEHEDLFAVAAAFNLPYETLATLNGWDGPGRLEPGQELLLPNMPGLFIPVTPLGFWETGLSRNPRETSAQLVRLQTLSGETRDYSFFPGEKFNAAERRDFLGSLFRSPLMNTQITSPFGYRPHPFTGKPSYHPGVDMRAAMRTPVMASRSGRISGTGVLEIYGLYVIIEHDGGYQSVYAHLDEILVEEGQVVNAGDRIALSGNSGISTGPHLHFEIRKDGVPADPSRLASF